MGGYFKTAVFLVTLSLAGCAAGPSRDVELNDQGYYAMQAGDLERAEDLLNQALMENPDNPHALTNLGALYQNTGRPGMARPLYERVIALASAQVERTSEQDRELGRLAAVARANLQMLEREEAEREAEHAAVPDPVIISDPVEALPAPAEEAPAPEPAGPDFRAQIGAFSAPANAERLQALLMEHHADVVAGRDVHLVAADGLTKVQIGPFASMREANQACRTLKARGTDCFPVRP